MSAKAGKRTCGKYLAPDARSRLTFTSGAYCATTIISLLDLPVDLPLDSPARRAGLGTLTERIPEYLSRCKIIASSRALIEGC